MYVVDKACNIYRMQGNPMIIIEFPPAIYKYYRVSHNMENLQRPSNAL